MSCYIPTSMTLAACIPPQIPWRCNWFGHKWKWMIEKTYPDNIRVPGFPHYYECARCMSRKVEVSLFSTEVDYDRMWVGAIFGKSHQPGKNPPPEPPPDRKVWKP